MMPHTRATVDSSQTTAILLGPHRHVVTVTDEFARLGLDGRIAAITAGWQEREREEDELQAAFGNRAVGLHLHARCEDVFSKDPELFAAHRRRQDRLRKLQELYRLRLGFALDAAAQLLAETGPDELMIPERESAIAAVRTLDADHLRRIKTIHNAFEHEMHLARRPVLAAHRADLQRLMQGCVAVAIAGGHVATLLGRMRLLDVASHIGRKPVLAWSAGAMVLTERVVLFHDRPPEGAGNAEVLDGGLGLCPGVVALPHAQTRLRLDDSARMSLFSKRFSPDLCIALDERCAASWDGQHWTGDPGTLHVDREGRLEPLDLRHHAAGGASK